jgi:Protein of unknown function (DUF1566)
MQTLEHELKTVIARRLEAAGSREVLAIASALCNGNALEPKVQVLDIPQGPRFQVDGDTVLDRTTGLEWSRDNVPGGTMNWKAAQEACGKLTLGGHSDWRLPTIRELLTLVDYERHDPAIDTKAFKCESSYYWTSTPLHSSPGGCAWGVDFYDGYALWNGQGNDDYVRAVRAVRASQGFDLWQATGRTK